MERKEAIRSAYRLTGGNNFYDGMITCTTLSGKAVCRLVWDMNKAECDAYLEKALSGIPDDFSGKLLEVPVGTGILTMPVYQTIPEADITCLDYSPDTLKKILWCDDDSIKPYFIAAGENLTYTNLRRQMADSLEDKPFPPLPEKLQEHTYFEFGSKEEHFKYRQAVMEAYPCGHYPVFEGYDHMQYQIRDPKGFAEMLAHIAERDCMPELPFIRK